MLHTPVKRDSYPNSSSRWTETVLRLDLAARYRPGIAFFRRAGCCILIGFLWHRRYFVADLKVDD